MKFVIYCPYMIETSGGCNVLLYLARKLSDYGEDARIFPGTPGGTSTIYDKLATMDDIDDDTIAIYPEGIANFLNAKRYVRWVLYGWSGRYLENEIIYYFHPFCKNNLTKKLLTLVYLPPNCRDLGLPRTNNSCYIVKKGRKFPSINKLFSDPTIVSKIEGTCLDEITDHSKVIEIFNTTKYFYCYDPACFLVIMALLCGCVVIQNPINGYTKEEWEYALGLGKLPGVAYGYSTLKEAEETISEAPNVCMKLFTEGDTHVKQFIEDMRTGNYIKEPMYPFTDSPFKHK